MSPASLSRAASPSEAPPRALSSLAFAVALAGALYSAYLTYLELFEIEAICAWCVASAAVVTLIALLSAPDLRQRRA